MKVCHLIKKFLFWAHPQQRLVYTVQPNSLKEKYLWMCFSIIFIQISNQQNRSNFWIETSMITQFGPHQWSSCFSDIQYDLSLNYGQWWLFDPMTSCGQFGFLQLSRFRKDMFSIFSEDPTLLRCLTVAVIWMESNDIRNYIETTLFSQLQFKCEIILTYNRAVIVH